METEHGQPAVSASHASGRARAAPRVLVVDDEPKLLASLQEGLRLEAWEVLTVETGGAALQRLGREEFDLIVLDWMLPDLDGMAVLREIRRRAPRLPVLMLTARSAPGDRAAARQHGATDYLAKPFAFSELVARCRTLLDVSA